MASMTGMASVAGMASMTKVGIVRGVRQTGVDGSMVRVASGGWRFAGAGGKDGGLGGVCAVIGGGGGVEGERAEAVVHAAVDGGAT